MADQDEQIKKLQAELFDVSNKYYYLGLETRYAQQPDRLDQGELPLVSWPSWFNPNGAVPRALSSIWVSCAAACHGVQATGRRNSLHHVQAKRQAERQSEREACQERPAERGLPRKEPWTKL